MGSTSKMYDARKTILITGASGYLGSHLVRALLVQGYRLAILTRSSSNLSRIESILPSIEIFNIEDGLEKPFKNLGHVDAVIHTATAYGRSGDKTLDIFEANVALPLSLLEVATHFQTRAFFNTDTFFNKKNKKYNYLGDYSQSKRHFMEWGKTFGEAEKIAFINLKLEHVYGPNDDISKFVPKIIRSCISNVDELELTFGHQQRDFIYIDDVVSAYTMLLLNMADFKSGFFSFDVGTGVTKTIKEFVKIIHQLSGSTTKLIFGALPYRKHEIMQSRADITPLRLLGWAPLYDLNAGLTQAIKTEMENDKLKLLPTVD